MDTERGGNGSVDNSVGGDRSLPPLGKSHRTLSASNRLAQAERIIQHASIIDLLTFREQSVRQDLFNLVQIRCCPWTALFLIILLSLYVPFLIWQLFFFFQTTSTSIGSVMIILATACFLPSLSIAWLLLYIKIPKGHTLYRPSALRQRLIKSSALLQSIFIIGITLYFALRLLGQVSHGSCESGLENSFFLCNPNHSSGLPFHSVLGVCFAPLVVYFLMRDTALEAVVVAIIISWISIACTTIFLSSAIQMGAILIFYIPCSSVLVIDSQRQQLVIYYMLEELQKILTENEQLADETHATELRHMIGNVAHDLKTPLASFLSGVETVAHILRDCEKRMRKRNTRLSRAMDVSEFDGSSDIEGEEEADFSFFLRESISAMQETIDNIKSTNSFMLMTINRCLDYTKASKGMDLVPKMETIDLNETLQLPLKIINDFQSHLQIRFDGLSTRICTHIITDRQWLIENMLCLLSNAVKYSSRGTVDVCVKLVKYMPVISHSTAPGEDTESPDEEVRVRSKPSTLKYGFSFKSLSSFKMNGAHFGIRSKSERIVSCDSALSLSTSGSDQHLRAGITQVPAAEPEAEHASEKGLFGAATAAASTTASTWSSRRASFSLWWSSSTKGNDQPQVIANHGYVVKDGGNTYSIGNAGDRRNHALKELESVDEEETNDRVVMFRSESSGDDIEAQHMPIPQHGSHNNSIAAHDSDKSNDHSVKIIAKRIENSVHQKGGSVRHNDRDFVDVNDAEVLSPKGGATKVDTQRQLHDCDNTSSSVERKTSLEQHDVPPAELSSSSKEFFLKFEVQDTGIGLSEEAMANLFNPFKQAQRLAGGTGLGLFSLAKRLEALGGKYGVRSRSDGQQGSMFWFTVPYRPDELSARIFIHSTDQDLTGSHGDNSQSDEDIALSQTSKERNIPARISAEMQRTGAGGGVASPMSLDSNDDDLACFVSTTTPPRSPRKSPFISPAANATHEYGFFRKASPRSGMHQIDEDKKSSASFSVSSSTSKGGSEKGEHLSNAIVPLVNNEYSAAGILKGIVEEASETMPTTAETAPPSTLHTRSSMQFPPQRRLSTISIDSTSSVPQQTLNILLVDDSLSIRKMTSMLLRRRGHKVTQADHGADALEKVLEGYERIACQMIEGNAGSLSPTANAIESNDSLSPLQSAIAATRAPFDVVLMDLQMPVMDGLEATRRLRAAEAGKYKKMQEENPDFLFVLKNDVGNTGNTSFRGDSSINSTMNHNETAESPMYAQLNRSGSTVLQTPTVRKPVTPFHQIVVGVSANSDHYTTQEAFKAGVDDFMGKPFSVDQFDEIVKKLVR